MPRKSRASITSSFLHVMVQGINKEYIFEKDQYKTKYLNLLFSNIKNFNVEIVSNCVMDNHSHCILYYKNVEDISKLMHIINTAYAKWYNSKNNRVGYVFRDRYKVEEIKDLHHLYSCIKYIHNNPVKAGIVDNPLDYQYSSYKDYVCRNGIYSNKLLEILQLNEIEIEDIILNPGEEKDDYVNINNPLEYNKKIEKYMSKKGLDINNREDRKEIVIFLKRTLMLKNTEISKIMNVSTKTIYRILKE